MLYIWSHQNPQSFSFKSTSVVPTNMLLDASEDPREVSSWYKQWCSKWVNKISYAMVSQGRENRTCVAYIAQKRHNVFKARLHLRMWIEKYTIFREKIYKIKAKRNQRAQCLEANTKSKVTQKAKNSWQCIPVWWSYAMDTSYFLIIISVQRSEFMHSEVMLCILHIGICILLISNIHIGIWANNEFWFCCTYYFIVCQE